jgi:hypothetical protein
MYSSYFSNFRPHTYFRSDYIIVFIQFSAWRWAQSCSKHVEDSNKYIIKEIVRQVGYLAELYKDVQSEEY